MNPRYSSPIVALLLGTVTLSAKEAPAVKEASVAKDNKETSAAKDKTVPPYELKNRSCFAEVDKNVRAPFWPIGWVKRKTGATAAVPSAPQLLLSEKSFKVTSILLGSGTTPSLAVINGRAYSEGEFLRTPKSAAATAPKVRLQRINDGNVVLQNSEQVLVASLQRPELSARKSEELLLDPDR